MTDYRVAGWVERNSMTKQELIRVGMRAQTLCGQCDLGATKSQ